MSHYENPINPSRPAPPKSKMKGWVIALIVGGSLFVAGIFLCMILLVFAVFSSPSTGPDYTGRDGYIAVLHIEGTITSAAPASSLLSGTTTYNQAFLLSTVDSLMNNADNKGILLFIDSPGGEVYATDELYLKLEAYKKATGRPIYAYCGSMAASGGYYLAASAGKILMNRNCMTGSIGVTAGTYIDISGFLEKQGIKTTSIYVGKNKTMGSYFEGFTDEQKAIYTTILKETYDQFVQIVADGRGMTTADVEVLADGRVYSPKQALANGIIDGIMVYDDAKAAMLKDNKYPDGVQFVDYYPTTNVGLSALLGVFADLKKSDLDSYLYNLNMPVDGPAYYYEGMGYQ